jgi:hypothetical protein
MGRLVVAMIALALVGCDRMQAQQSASVTVKLPPARPYAPQPAFSFGAAPRTQG